MKILSNFIKKTNPIIIIATILAMTNPCFSDQVSINGDVSKIHDETITIKTSQADTIPVGSRVDLFFEISEGQSIAVGQWKVSSAGNGEVIATPVDVLGPPRKGMTAKISFPEGKKQIQVIRQNHHTSPTISQDEDSYNENQFVYDSPQNTDKTKEITNERHVMISNPLDKLDEQGTKQMPGKKGKNSLVQAAEKGDSQAQNKLGWNYQKGINLKKDFQKAIFWYRKAAVQGNEDAQNNLGWMYQNGVGVKKELNKAVYWYRKAADHGYSYAQDNLAWMYQKGLGIEQSNKQAVYWYNKAAVQGNNSAQNNLGWMYQNGVGVPADRQIAVFWYKKAAKNGNKFAKNNLKNMGEIF